MGKYIFFSKLAVNGIGVSKDPILVTGASKYSKRFSFINAAISAPIPPVKLAS